MLEENDPPGRYDASAAPRMGRDSRLTNDPGCITRWPLSFNHVTSILIIPSPCCCKDGLQIVKYCTALRSIRREQKTWRLGDNLGSTPAFLSFSLSQVKATVKSGYKSMYLK